MRYDNATLRARISELTTALEASEYQYELLMEEHDELQEVLRAMQVQRRPPVTPGTPGTSLTIQVWRRQDGSLYVLEGGKQTAYYARVHEKVGEPFPIEVAQ
jgi:hypothetical protein